MLFSFLMSGNEYNTNFILFHENNQKTTKKSVYASYKQNSLKNKKRTDIGINPIVSMVEMTGVEPASKRESLARTTVYPMIG